MTNKDRKVRRNRKGCEDLIGWGILWERIELIIMAVRGLREVYRDAPGFLRLPVSL